MTLYTSDYFSSVLPHAIPVRLAARSFVIPVPAGIGQNLIYPENVEGQSDKKKGMPILGSSGKPKGTGLLFYNYTDDALQSVRDDGSSMIIVNALTEKEAEDLFTYYKDVISQPEKASAQDIVEILRYAHDELKIDDFFNSRRNNIPGYEVVEHHPNDPDCGIFIRRNNQHRTALIGLGSGSFLGRATTPHRFKDNVAVISNERYTWLAQTKAFLLSYTHPDKREIGLADVPAFVIRPDMPPQPALRL